jgi:peptidoglycan/LPS O-acetylase OafA/YrhL
LYYLTVAFAFVVAPHIQLLDTASMQGQVLTFSLFLQNFTAVLQQPHGAAFDNLWSLAVEEQFYLVLPILVLRVSPRRLPQVLLVGVALGLAVRVGLFVTDASPIANFKLMPSRMDAFAIGGLLSLGIVSPTWRPRLARAAAPVAWFTAIVLLVLAAVQVGFDAYEPAMRTWGYAVTALFFGSVLVLGLTSQRLGGWLSTPWLRLIGATVQMRRSSISPSQYFAVVGP